jgi:hypothetical protein
MAARIERWTVDYGDGPRDALVPHAWRQDVPVAWEGPAIYRATLDLTGDAWLVFHGVSYAATVRANGRALGRHEGIWDAWSVPLAGLRGTVELEVEVMKNGGPTYPVRDVASGFLPFVFHTFGGIYQGVDLVYSATDPLAEPPPAPPTRVRVEGHKVFVDGRPFYARGYLSWGWYPETGHTNPPAGTVRRELRLARERGFNLVKFCLWVPPQCFLELLREEGLFAWIELPLWDPSPDPAAQERIAAELERIVRQYRRHDHVILWTAGCELSHTVGAAYRQSLVEMVRRETGCPLVKDNSGGAEMYGGDLREYGTFDDFHPYCDAEFYPPVLDEMLTGARARRPAYLGEFNDLDVHRDLPRLRQERPFWTSSDPALNDQGVRWQHVIAQIFGTPLARGLDPRHDELMEASRQKAFFVRKYVYEAVRARQEYAGTVLTGWRDTPITTSGIVDDRYEPRFSPEEMAPWHGPDALFLIPTRRLVWLPEGNRPNWLDPYNFEEGPLFWRIGGHSERGLRGRLAWRLRDGDRVAASGEGEPMEVPPLESHELGEAHAQAVPPGEYVLEAEFAGVRNEWPIWVVPSPRPPAGWRKHDPGQALYGYDLGDGENLLCTSMPPDWADRLRAGHRIVWLMRDAATRLAPFWRECIHRVDDKEFWDRLGLGLNWSRWLPVSGERRIEPAEFAALLPPGAAVAPVLTRIDTRTYRETPIALRVRLGAGRMLATTLGPEGGRGMAPQVRWSPAGRHVLAQLMRSV